MPAWANELVSYNAPRLVAAGKLALRGVKTNAVPYNMTALATSDDLKQLKR